ncbi:MAG: tetratricopeptide repeat protein [Bacteroidia bacterium]|nr:tetratricopeptide repeat protein [Bacteroidia bacterium]
MGNRKQEAKNKHYGLKTLGLLACFLLPALLFTSCSLFRGGAGRQYAGAKVPLTAEQSDRFKSTYYDAETEKITEDYDQALNLFKLCLEIDPSSAAANFEIADILEGTKHSDSAIYYSKRAAQLEPSNIWFEDLYAQCLQDKGDYKGVAEVYRSIVKDNPEEADYYAKLGAAELQAGLTSAALATYNSMEAKFGFNEDVSMDKVRVFEKAKNYLEAENEIKKLIREEPSTPEYYDMLGNVYELEGKKDKAFSLYRQMEGSNPNDPMAHLALADYYHAQHNDKDSYRELELAFAETRLDVNTEIGILIGFYEATDGHDSLMTEGLRLCKIMTATHPDDPKGHNSYGNFLIRNRDFMKAREQYSLSISEDSGKYSNWSQLLLLDQTLNDYHALALASQSALNIFPGYPQLYLDNGIANLELKNYPEAISSLQQGLQYVLGDSGLLVQFYSSLGDAYNAVKRFGASDSAYEAALALNPDDDYVLNNYSYYLSIRNTRLERAAAMSKRANAISPLNANYEDTYAWILFTMGQYKEAKEWQEGALRDGGDKNANILEHYGDILFKLGEKEKAADYWQKARDTGSSSELLERKIRDKQYYSK